MNKIDSLYQLIKEKSQQKGRKLKIICDWDECLMPLRPAAVHKFLGSNLNIPFESFFKGFWEKIIATNEPSGFKIHGYEGSEEEKKAIEKYEENKRLRNKNIRNYDAPSFEDGSWPSPQNFYASPERFKAPFLSFTEELLQCLKENLISELVIISSVRKKGFDSQNKERKFQKTFAHFRQCKIDVYENYLREKVERWQHIEKNYPDFDMFIDDDYYYINSTREKFGKEKIYVLPDYKYSRGIQGDNIYHVKQVVSDIKEGEFATTALELKIKEELAKIRREREREREQFIELLGVR